MKLSFRKLSIASASASCCYLTMLSSEMIGTEGFSISSLPASNSASTSATIAARFRLSSPLFASTDLETEDCGCATPTTFTGRPSSNARNSIQHRRAIAKLPLFRLDGEETTMDQIMGSDVDSDSDSDTGKLSLVVFLRSLGCPFCQEQIVQYNQVRETLLASNINLTVVSIGLPEKGYELIKHLEVDKTGMEWIYVDPSNTLYDALELNGGITNFITAETPFAFRDRIFGMNGRQDGIKGLLDIMSKWKDAIYVPPETTQAFQQGGAFIFKGLDTVFAHYDGSTGTHIEVRDVVERALNAAKEEII